MCCFFQIQFTEKNQSRVNSYISIRTLLCTYYYRYKASKNTTSERNPGKAYISSVLCKSFVTFSSMFPDCFLLCYTPRKEIVFCSAPHVFTHSNWSVWLWLRLCLQEQHILVGSAVQDSRTVAVGSHDVYQVSRDLLQPGSPCSLASMSDSNGRTSVKSSSSASFFKKCNFCTPGLV